MTDVTITSVVNTPSANIATLSGNNAWTGNETHAGTETFNASTVLNGALTGTSVKDEDNMASDSATAVPTQQSVKAYVTSTVSAYVPYTGATGDVNLGDNKIIVDSDTKGIELGAGQDMSAYYDGTQGNIKTDLIAASDLHIDCGTAKTLVLDIPVYDDVRVTPAGFDRAGVKDPSLVSYTPTGSSIATYLYEFQVDDIAYFTVQMPHSYKVGEDIKVHVHWTPGLRGNEENGKFVGWKVDYTWANINGTFGAMGTANLSDACDGTDDKHQMTPEATIDGHTVAKGISSMLLCNIKRTDTGTDDDWVGTASGELPLLLEIDFHFPMDTLGSRDWGTK